MYEEDTEVQFKQDNNVVAQSGLRAVVSDRLPLSHYASMRGSLTMDPGSEAACGHTVDSLTQEIEQLKWEIRDRDLQIRQSVADRRYRSSRTLPEASKDEVYRASSLMPGDVGSMRRRSPVVSADTDLTGRLPPQLFLSEPRSGRPVPGRTSHLVPEVGSGQFEQGIMLGRHLDIITDRHDHASDDWC